MSELPDYARLQIPIWKDRKPPCVEDVATHLRELADAMLAEIKPEYPPHLRAMAMWFRIGEANQKLSELDSQENTD